MTTVEPTHSDASSDPRVAAIVARLRAEFGQSCQQDGPSTWRFEVPSGEGRSQIVTLFIREQFHVGRDLSRFVAFSPIGPVVAGVPLEPLLRQNSELDIGSTAIEDIWTRDGVRIPFVVFRATHLVATADYPEIWELIVKTAEYADNLERDVYSRDLF